MEEFEEDVADSGERRSRMDQKKKDSMREIKSWILSLFAAVAIALCIRFFVFEFVRVDGPSMEPTLYTDEYVFMEKVTYWFRKPQRGDIVICSFPNSSESYVKRVIGIPGDVIEVKNGVLYINGSANYDYDFWNKTPIEKPPVPNPITVPENCVFVMGDHRNQSNDSRYPEIGPIPYDKILGKAEFVIWPFDKIHGL